MKEWLNNASVEIKGTDVNGTPVTITGDIEDTRIEVDAPLSGWNTGKISKGSQYYLKFKPQDDNGGVQYTIKLKTTTVERTAEIEVSGCTPKQIERARIAVGAPEDAGVRPVPNYWPEAVRLDLKTQKTKLFFIWTEEVVVK